MNQAIERQRAEDAKATSLVDTINKTLEFVEDAKKVEQLKDDPAPLKPIISDLLRQIAECAIFISHYFQNGFISRHSPNNRIVEGR